MKAICLFILICILVFTFGCDSDSETSNDDDSTDDDFFGDDDDDNNDDDDDNDDSDDDDDSVDDDTGDDDDDDDDTGDCSTPAAFDWLMNYCHFDIYDVHGNYMSYDDVLDECDPCLVACYLENYNDGCLDAGICVDQCLGVAPSLSNPWFSPNPAEWNDHNEGWTSIFSIDVCDPEEEEGAFHLCNGYFYVYESGTTNLVISSNWYNLIRGENGESCHSLVTWDCDNPVKAELGFIWSELPSYEKYCIDIYGTDIDGNESYPISNFCLWFPTS